MIAMMKTNSFNLFSNFAEAFMILCDFQEWLEAKPSEGMNILYTGVLQIVHNIQVFDIVRIVRTGVVKIIHNI